MCGRGHVRATCAVHGELHQSVEEVVSALLSGKPAARWPHVYTGNVARAEPLFAPVVPALPATPSTPLARCLVGIDAYEMAPHATRWLLEHPPRSAAAAAAEHDAIRTHRRMMLGEMIGSLRRRLRRLATCKRVVCELTEPRMKIDNLRL